MKKSPKHVVKVAVMERTQGAARSAAVEIDDAEGIATFTSVHAHKGFTKENALRAFAGIKFNK